MRKVLTILAAANLVALMLVAPVAGSVLPTTQL